MVDPFIAYFLEIASLLILQMMRNNIKGGLKVQQLSTQGTGFQNSDHFLHFLVNISKVRFRGL